MYERETSTDTGNSENGKGKQNSKTFSYMVCSLFHFIKLYRDLSKQMNVLAYLFSSL